MLIKDLKKLFFFLSLVLSLNQQSYLYGQAIPLGIVLRDSLFKKLITELNKSDAEKKPTELSFCINDVASTLKIEGQWSEPIWKRLNEKVIYLSAAAKNVRLSFKLFDSCEENKKSQLEGSLFIAHGKFNGLWNISDFSINLNIDARPENIIAKVDHQAGLQKLLQTAGSETIIQALVALANQQISKWISGQFNDLFYAQSAAELMKDMPLLKSGKLFERGAIKLELADPKPAQEHITFSFYRRKNGSTFASENALEFYFNTAFLDVNRLSDLSGLDPFSNSNEAVMKGVKMALANLGPENDPPLLRPSLDNSTSDMSLILPEALINSALSLFYKEGLTGLRAVIGVGQQTKGIIAKDEQEVSTILTIKPDVAPSVNFLPDQFRLEVTDYVMDVGTYIEDRIIPANQISSHISISAHIEVDASKQKIKLLLNPEDLLLKLEALKKKMDDVEIDFFKKVANGVWKDYLLTNSDIYLFPLVFNPRGVSLEVVQTHLEGKNIILDLNLGDKK